MSDSTTKVSFTISQTQAPLRLIELPPAILSLIQSDNPPTVYIKSSPPLPPNERSTSTADHAVLCTPTATYALRQVHSSNITYLITPSSNPNTPIPDDTLTDFPDAEVGLSTVTAISSVTSHLEPLPHTPDTSSLLLPHLLPFPTPPTTSGNHGNHGKSKSWILSNIPAHTTAINSAFASLVVFETSGSCYLPSPAILLRTMKEILTTADAERIVLCPSPPLSPQPFGLQKLLDSIFEDGPMADIPGELVGAVVEVIADGDGSGGWVFNRERAVEMVGRWILAEKGNMVTAAFLRVWREHLPEGCEGLCKIEGAKWCEKSGGLVGLVGLVGGPTPGAAAAGTSGVEKNVEEKPVTTKNKWHEKFRKTRK